MTSDVGHPSLRTDAARNREAILAAAARAFATPGAEPSLRAVAREAGVGVGTLYRHFPTKEALVEAVYQDQATRLVDGAGALLATHPPLDALRRWTDLFAQWLTAKHGMGETLLAMVGEGQISVSHSRTQLLAAIESMLAAGRAAGDVRDDVQADDVADALLGILSVLGPAPDPARAARILDWLVDGLRATR